MSIANLTREPGPVQLTRDQAHVVKHFAQADSNSRTSTHLHLQAIRLLVDPTIPLASASTASAGKNPGSIIQYCRSQREPVSRNTMSKNDTTKDGAVALKNDNVTYLMACLQNMKSGTAVVNHEAAGAVIGLTASGSSSV